ncbi:hypothetical protein ILYODFUR_011842 [Ilyodon furcidens]|uniref:SH3 domain-containing protein n=1 Tax=Ilyodon furcidens TaxID=33524 RepID=A0ABV0V350_9TELE
MVCSFFQANSQPAQPAADAGFAADWSADFGSMSANGDVASAAVPIASEMPEGQQVGVQGGAQCWPQAESSPPGGDTTSVQDSEPRRKEDEDVAAPSFFTDFDKLNDVESEKTEVPEASQKQAADQHNKATAPHGGGEQCTNPSVAAGEDTEHLPVEAKVEEMPAPPAGEVRESEAGSDVEEEKEKSLDTLHEEEQAIKAGIPEEEPPEVPQADETKSCEGESAPSERMPIPSVVIEPASSNEGDDDRDADIISPTAVSDNSVTSQSNTLKHMSPSGGGSGFPDDFLYKVETMHDFEAANSDELELKRGDVVLVVPTASVEDQEAGWLTGMKESDWERARVQEPGKDRAGNSRNQMKPGGASTRRKAKQTSWEPQPLDKPRTGMGPTGGSFKPPRQPPKLARIPQPPKETQHRNVAAIGLRQSYSNKSGRDPSSTTGEQYRNAANKGS